MNRRSTRIKAKPNATASGSTSIYAEYDDDDYEEPLATALSSSGGGKRRRVTSGTPLNDEGKTVKKPRLKRGMLHQLTEMPMDVLFEIFGQLNPIDVLHLARTTKALRSILMNRSAISVWKQACSNIPHLPPCPPDLQEPQWVNLAFGKNCHFCLKSHSSQTIVWEARVRACSKCIEEKFSAPSYSDELIYDAYSLLPSVIIRTGRRPREVMRKSTETQKRWTAEYKTLQSPKERSEWLSERRKERAVIMQHVVLCEAWMAKQNAERSREQEAIRTERQDLVRQKLEDLGWGEEIRLMEHPQYLWQHPLMTALYRRESFTDRAWIGVKDALIGCLTDMKTSRLGTLYKAALKKRHLIIHNIHARYEATLLPNVAVLPACEIYLAPAFRDKVENTPAEVELTENSFDELKDLIPEINREWVDRTNQTLLSMVRNPIDAQSEEAKTYIPRLDLATSIFGCFSCSARLMLYPRMLMHQCASFIPSWMADDPNVEPNIKLFNQTTHCCQWNARSVIKWQSDYSKNAVEVVTSAGLDPTTTTIQEINALDPIFECITCPDPRNGRKMFDWKAAIRHKSYHTSMQLKLLDGETKCIIQGRFAEERGRKRAQLNYSGLFCVHCGERGDSVNLRTHLKDRHDISEASKEDVQECIDADHNETTYSYWSFPSI